MLRLRESARAGEHAAAAMSDAEVQARLFKALGRNEPLRRAPIDMTVHQEMRRAGVTLQLLWSESVAAVNQEHGLAPYQYSQFCDLYATFRGKVDVSMRQLHRAGEKLFID